MIAQLTRLFKHSAIYGLAETISRGTSFILVFIYTRVLTESDLGIRTAIYGVSAVLGLFYTLGIDNAFLRYFMDDSLKKKRGAIFSSAVIFSAIIGILFLCVIMFQGKNLSLLLTQNSSYTYIVHILFMIMVLDSVTIYPMLVLRAENKLYYYSLLSFLRFFLFISLNILLVWYMDRGLNGVFEANLITLAAVGICILPIYKQYFSPQISYGILKRMLLFGIPTIFTLLCMRVIDISDRYVILFLLGDDAKAELGKYSVAYTLGMVGVMVFVHSFRVAWQPFFLTMRNNPEARTLFSRVATYYAIFIGLVLLGITLFRQELFHLYAPDLPGELSLVVPIVSFAYVFFGFYIIMLAGIFIQEKTRYLPIVTFIAASINLGLNFIFIPKFGIIGAAYTTLIAYIVMVLLMYAVSNAIYRVYYDFKRLSAVFALTLIPIALSLLVKPSNLGLDYLFRCILLIIPIIVYLSDKFLMPEELNYLKRVITKALALYPFRRNTK